MNTTEFHDAIWPRDEKPLVSHSEKPPDMNTLRVMIQNESNRVLSKLHSRAGAIAVDNAKRALHRNNLLAMLQSYEELTAISAEPKAVAGGVGACRRCGGSGVKP